MTKEYKNPVPTVDIIIEISNDNGEGIILIDRKNEPFGWALPGGFVDYGESLEDAAVREAKEETDLDIELDLQFQTYSDPARDPRMHTISTVFIAQATGTPTAKDDAKDLKIYSLTELAYEITNDNLCFDHGIILSDYLQFKEMEQA